LQERALIKYLKNLTKRKGGFLNVFKDTYDGVVIILTTPFRVVSMVHELLENGGFTIESEFSYDDLAYRITTFIQPDGDIVTTLFVPYFSEIPIHELELPGYGGERLMAEYHVHNQKLILAFDDLQGRAVFFGFVIDTSLLVSNFYPIYQLFIEQSSENYVIAGLTAVGTYLFRKFAKRFVIQKTVQGVLFFVQKWVEKGVSRKWKDLTS
jgi:hypothetical protein